MQKKARPLDVKVEIVNKTHWKRTDNLEIKVSGLFRNSGWEIKSHSCRVVGDLIRVEINTRHHGGISLMVLTPFEVIEKIQIPFLKDNYKIQVIVDEDELITQSV